MPQAGIISPTADNLCQTQVEGQSGILATAPTSNRPNWTETFLDYPTHTLRFEASHQDSDWL